MERAEPGEREPGRAAVSLRVLHVVSSLEVGGMEQFVLRLAGAQRAAGLDARVLAVRDGPLRGEAEAAGMPVTVLPRSRGSRLAGALRQVLALRPCVLHAHNPSALPYALPGRLLPGVRTVLTRHGQLLPWAPGRVERALLDRVVAVSGAAEAALRARAPALGQKLVVIRNGVEPVRPSRERGTVRAELGLGEAPAGLLVARMDGRKGHATLLRALAQLPPGRGMPLLLAGDGAERGALEALASELGLSEVRFLGWRKDIPDLLGAADLFLLPSQAEGLPLSVLEAMAAGLPVVATAVGGVPELVRDGVDGLLVPVDETEPLAAAIERLRSDPELRRRMGEAGRARALGEFSFAAMMERYEALYRSL